MRLSASLVKAILIAVFSVGICANVLAAKGNMVSLKHKDLARDVPAPTVITLGKARVLEIDGRALDVLVADPNIVDVELIQANKMYVVGANIGDTNIITLDEKGNVISSMDVHVSFDSKTIQSLIDELFPQEDVIIGSIQGQILLTGSVSTPEVASKVSNVVGHYVSELQDSDRPIDELISNLMEVRGEQQVMLKVKIIEATRRILKELGIESDFNDNVDAPGFTIFERDGSDGLPSISNLSPGASSARDQGSLALRAGAGVALTEDPAASFRALLDSGISGLGTLGIFIDALDEQNLVNILAEPNLTAVSGEEAGFLAGGEFPVPSGRDQFGNITVDFRNFGVSLNFRPRVLSSKRISLQLQTEVSSLDFDNAVVLADVTVPGLDIRRASTTVEVSSGGSLMIAGLLESETLDSMSGLPGISNTPILGDLVSSEAFQREETELVVIVTPYLVEPYNDKSQATPEPMQKESPLSLAFATNIRRYYEIDEDDDIFESDTFYGYLLD